MTPLKVGDSVGVLGAKLDGQTANLERANGRTADVIAIVDSCDARQAKLLKKRGWW